MAADDITTLDFTRPCPVCDHHMELSMIETVPWAARTAGERVVFRCPTASSRHGETSVQPRSNLVAASGRCGFDKSVLTLGRPDRSFLWKSIPLREGRLPTVG